MNRNVEILAPAGSFMSMQASFKAGADAVYMGGRRFGARAYAENPEDDELLKAIDYAHMRGKRLYLTVNTIVKENELEALYDYLKPLYLHGLDAVIVQDLGVLHMISKSFPKLPIHISTQMSLTTAEAVKLLGGSVVRVVPARELSLDEIAAFKKDSGLELEVFVHGALCYSYSGQCLFSSACGDRSGNRGRCAQPCRKPYRCDLPDESVFSGSTHAEWEMYGEDGKYLLSPKDICTLDRIPDLIEAGVDSFKIEGRMKSPVYACGVTEIYRRAVDLYYQLGREGYYEYIKSHPAEWQENRIRLADLFNRGGFSEGYAFSGTGRKMMSINRPNHEGVCVGEALVRKGFAELKTIVKLYPGDVLEIRDSRRTDWYSYTTSVESPAGSVLRFKAAAGESRTPEEIRVRVFRIRCEKLLLELKERYVEAKDCIPVAGTVYLVPGSELVCSVETAQPNRITGKKYYAAAAGEKVSEAVNAPLMEKTVSDKVKRSGDSEFEFTELSVELEGKPFAAKSVLGKVRRQTLEALRQEICRDFRRTEDGAELAELRRAKDGADSAELRHAENGENAAEFRNPGERGESVKCGLEKTDAEKKKVLLSCVVAEKGQLNACISLNCVDRIVIDMEMPVFDYFSENAKKLTEKSAENGKPLFFRTAQVADEKNLEELRTLIARCIRGAYGKSVAGFYVRNLSAAQVIREVFNERLSGKRVCGEEPCRVPYLIADNNLYAANSDAAEWLADHGFAGFVYSSELSGKETAELNSGLDASGNPLMRELLLYGREQLMLSKQCVKNSLNRCNGKREWLKITSEEGREFPVYTDCKSCRNRIYNAYITDLRGKINITENPDIDVFRFEFTKENGSQTKEVLSAFSQIFCGESAVSETGKNLKNEKIYNFGHFERPVL